MANRYSIFEVKRSWWYHSLRATSMLFYRYWWLVWLLFILYLILWYIFCFLTPLLNCSQNELIKKRIAAVNQRLDSCCDCSAVSLHPIPPREVNPCDYDESMSGGEGYTEKLHNLGDSPGIVMIKFNMQIQPDKMDVYYDGQLVASTNKLTSGTGSLSFYYPAQPGKPTYCKIVLNAPQHGTVWDYHIGCPR